MNYAIKGFCAFIYNNKAGIYIPGLFILLLLFLIVHTIFSFVLIERKKLMFIFNSKKRIDMESIKILLKQEFDMTENDIDELLSINKKAEIRFQNIKREPDTELNYELTIWIPEKLCSRRGIYNELQLALPLSDLIGDEVVISEKSDDPSRWILVKPESQVYIFDEELDENNDYSFKIDRSSLKSITLKEALVHS